MSDPERLVVVCGLPGTGKTTVATEVADRVGGRLLRTDVVRKDLVDDPDYTDAETRRVYDELLDRAERTLGRGGRPSSTGRSARTASATAPAEPRRPRGPRSTS